MQSYISISFCKQKSFLFFLKPISAIFIRIMKLLNKGDSKLNSLVYKIRHREIVRLTRSFSDRQWMGTQELLADSDRLARKLARHAAAHVEHYKNIFKNLQMNPVSMKFPEDWERLPILDKDTLREKYNDLISAPEYGHSGYVNYSGGSTGTPVKFLSDLELHKRMVAWLDLMFSWAGWKPGELRMEFWGNKKTQLPPALWDRIRASLSGHFAVAVYDYNEKSMQDWWQAMSTLHPTIIYGYPSVLTDFSRWLDSENHRPKGVKGVFCSAEVLYPSQRKIIEKIFQCKVFNQYGSRETPCVACECPEGNMHLFVDFNRVEFLNTEENADGNKDIIITPLYNYAQPLLRYQLGDLGKLLDRSCNCGRGYPLMEINIARSGDLFKGKDGNKIFPSFFIHMLDGNDWIRSFQFKQKTNYKIELTIETTIKENINYFQSQLMAAMVPQIKKKMGSQVELKIKIADKIDRTGAGKHRYVINELQDKDSEK